MSLNDDGSDDGSGDSSGGDSDVAEFEPDPVLEARIETLRRDNVALQAIVSAQDRVLEEMEQRTREIQAATAARRAELNQLRAARERRAAAAAEEAARAQQQEKQAAEVAELQGEEKVKKAAIRGSEAGLGDGDGNGGDKAGHAVSKGGVDE